MNIKGIIIACSLFAISGVIACCKEDPAINTTVGKCDYKSSEVIVSFPFKDTGNVSATNGAIIDLLPAGLSTDNLVNQAVDNLVKKDLALQGIDSCQVSNIYVDNMRITIDSPSNKYFNFLDSLTIFASADKGVTKKLIAYKTGLAANSTQVVMDIVPSVDLRPYLLLDTCNLLVGGRKGSTPAGWGGTTTYFSIEALFKGKAFTKP
jgi:hypothetical protein